MPILHEMKRGAKNVKIVKKKHASFCHSQQQQPKQQHPQQQHLK